jgi:hypothetical protein
MSNSPLAWDYKVIHLNVESDQAATPRGDASQNAEPPFTKTYLEQEFPGYYTPHGDAGTAMPAPTPPPHPARQLQDFLNSHGHEGWAMVGIYPLGAMLMMIFRRPALKSPSPQPTPASSGAVADDAELLRRLDALEARLSAQQSAAASAAADGRCLNPDALAALKRQRQPVSSSEAARALGFRSTASLANLGNRAGYPPGLMKCGLNATLAVYVGTGVGSRGGKPTRLWAVMRQADLDTLP